MVIVSCLRHFRKLAKYFPQRRESQVWYRCRIMPCLTRLRQQVQCTLGAYAAHTLKMHKARRLFSIYARKGSPYGLWQAAPHSNASSMRHRNS